MIGVQKPEPDTKKFHQLDSQMDSQQVHVSGDVHCIEAKQKMSGRLLRQAVMFTASKKKEKCLRDSYVMLTSHFVSDTSTCVKKMKCFCE